MARQPKGNDGGRWMVAWQVGQFTLAGLMPSQSSGSRRCREPASRKREAIVDARTQTVAKAQGFIEPAVTNGLKTANPAAVARIDKVVKRDLLDAELVRVKIWTANGTIVYSDEPRLIGTRYTLGPDERAALNDGLIEAEVSDLTKPENRFERAQRKLLEVYLPIRTPDGERLLFEAYFRYDAVVESGSNVWRSFAPITIGALIALELVQIPLAYSLARRLRQRQLEREGLLRGHSTRRTSNAVALPAICTMGSCRTSPASRSRSAAPRGVPTSRPTRPSSSIDPLAKCARASRRSARCSSRSILRISTKKGSKSR